MTNGGSAVAGESVQFSGGGTWDDEIRLFRLAPLEHAGALQESGDHHSTGFSRGDPPLPRGQVRRKARLMR
jgi:hypothetical protein